MGEEIIGEELWINCKSLYYNALGFLYLSLQVSWIPIPFFLTQKYMFELYLIGEWTHIPTMFLW